MAEINEVESKALTIIEQAGAVTITDSETYTNAGCFYKDIGTMIKEVKDTFDPICDAANRAHKEATSKRAKYLDPLQVAYKKVKSLMSDYDAEQERIRRIEEDRLRKIAEDAERKRLEEERRAEEERVLNEAIEAEANGDTNVAEAILEAPVYQPEPTFTPAPVVPKSVPKISGVSYRTLWSAEVVNIDLIPRKYLVADMVMLNKIASAEKERMNVPGVKVISRRV